MLSYKEYLNNRGKVQEKPIQATVDNIGDQAPEPDKYPPASATSGKNWKVTTPKDKAKAYSNPGTDPGQPKYDRGFGQDGDKKLIYEPKSGVPYEKEGGKKITSWPQGKTETFLNDTSNMALAEFASYVSGLNKPGTTTELPTVTGYKMGPYYPNPLEAMRYVVALASANDRLMESLVIMLKNQGKLDTFLREASNHSDTYDELAFLLADPENGTKFARRLVKALSEVSIREITAPPAQDDEEIVKAPKKKSPLKPDPNGPPAAQQPDQGQNASTPATMQGQELGQQAMAGVQQTQGGGPQMPEANLLHALASYKMI